jgi:Domain of unknown function (DUF4395)
VSALLGFPNPVNEKAARTVAAVVALTAAPGLGRFAMWFARSRLGRPRYVPGPPKRFAHGIGALCTTVGAVALAAGSTAIPVAMLALMIVFATLESVVAFCAGCAIFGGLMRLGLIPERICLECSDIAARQV